MKKRLGRIRVLKKWIDDGTTLPEVFHTMYFTPMMIKEITDNVWEYKGTSPLFEEVEDVPHRHMNAVPLYDFKLRMQDNGSWDFKVEKK